MDIELDLLVEIDDFDEIISEEEIKNYVVKVLEYELEKNKKENKSQEKNQEKEKPFYLSVAFVDNKIIREVNRVYRGKDSVTDVISFAYHETEDYDVGPYDTLGDILISVEQVKAQAIKYEHTFEREFYYILTHGLLHLLGYDHMIEDEKKIMREKEEEILKKFGVAR
ncbi:MAG: rRNA maturation RNase YbeY [Fusobacteriaceae bacterium]